MFKRKLGSKYKAKKTEIDGIVFDSRVEGDYYIYLMDLKKNGTVISFVIQPKYELQEKFIYKYNGTNIRAMHYVADFEVLRSDGRNITVDVKGMATSDAKLKRKLFMYKYPNRDLQWVVKYRGDWVSFDNNEKRKRENRKNKKNKKLFII